MKSFSFPQPDGTVLVVTQSADDANKFTSRYEDGTTVADRIRDLFDAGAIKK